MMKLLQNHGWQLVKIKGSHHRFIKKGFLIDVIVPVHGKKELKIGTEKSILKDADLLMYWKDRTGGKK